MVRDRTYDESELTFIFAAVMAGLVGKIRKIPSQDEKRMAKMLIGTPNLPRAQGGCESGADVSG